jgi:surfeit locus 1 family protein
MSLTGFPFRFTPRWQIVVLTLVSVVGLIRLGVWQQHRAVEKRNMIQTQQRQSAQVPIVWQPTEPLPVLYQPIEVTGRYLPTTFLLDNQVEQHRFGYHVLSPLQLADRRIVLVDRGWIQGDVTRQSQPTVLVPTKTRRVVGEVYYPSQNPWNLGSITEKISGNTVVVEWISTEFFSQFLHKPVNPFIIRLKSGEPYGYLCNWRVVAMPATRHDAYAAQWFAMAGLVSILFIVLNIKKKT